MANNGIKIPVSFQQIYYNDTEVVIRVTYPDGVKGDILTPTSNVTWCKLTKTQLYSQATREKVFDYTFTVETNLSNAKRSCSITFQYKDFDGTKWENVFTLEQGASYSDNYVYAIWKDIYFEPADIDETSADFTIKDAKTDTEIYQGHIYRNPQTQKMTTNLSKICQDYVYMDWNNRFLSFCDTSYVQRHENAYKSFKIYCNYDVYTYSFFYSWDYLFQNQSYTSLSRYKMLNEPINGHFCNSNKISIPFTVRAFKDKTNIPVTGIEGTLLQVVNKGVTSFSFYDNSNRGKNITVGGISYKGGYCGRYHLIYLNSHGGYDYYLIETPLKRTDNFEKYQYNRSFDNSKPNEFEAGVYHNQIITRYEFTTGWMSDEEADRLARNLLGSNEVYLWDTEKYDDLGYTLPEAVIVSNDLVEYKKYRQNKQMAKYTITLEKSQRTQRL